MRDSVDLLYAARAALSAGRFNDAEEFCQSVLDWNRARTDALELLSHVFVHQGRFPEAEALIREAAQSCPQIPGNWCNLASLLLAKGDSSAALTCYDKAIAAERDFVPALLGRAQVLRDLGRVEEALECFGHVLALNPDNAIALSGQGDALLAVNQCTAAIDSFERAVRAAGPVPAALNNWGVALAKSGRLEEALECFERLLLTEPCHLMALINRANVFYTRGDYDEALGAYDKACAVDSNSLEGLLGRGRACIELMRYREAQESFLAALASHSRNADVLAELGHLALMTCEFDAALAYASAAVAETPTAVAALRTLAMSTHRLGRHAEAIGLFRRVLALNPTDAAATNGLAAAAAQSCEWATVDESTPRMMELVRNGDSAVHPFTFLALCDSPAAHRQCAARHAASKWPDSRAPLDTATRPPSRRRTRLRLAYLSSDWCRHAIAYHVAELLELHDRAQFEVIGVTRTPDDGSAIRARIMAACDRLYDVTDLTDSEVALLLRDADIDIAVDLGGFTMRSLLGALAPRPAPVQVTYLGYPGTLGTNFIDYVIADPIVLPMIESGHYSESIVHLPDSYQVNDRHRRAAEGTTRQREGLPERGFVFCCFNQPFKITREVFAVWMRLLSTVDGSVLWLHAQNDDAVVNLSREASLADVDQERLVFCRSLRLEEHLARHKLADLCLDTLPYSSHATGSNALWAGVPMVTCLGRSFAGRVGASLVAAAGLPSLITHTMGEYEALALGLATDAALLRSVRDQLSRNRLTCPLFDTDRFRVHLERAYSIMWERHTRGEPPSHLVVPADPLRSASIVHYPGAVFTSAEDA